MQAAGETMYLSDAFKVRNLNEYLNNMNIVYYNIMQTVILYMILFCQIMYKYITKTTLNWSFEAKGNIIHGIVRLICVYCYHS